jgi:hypothetical protein
MSGKVRSLAFGAQRCHGSAWGGVSGAARHFNVWGELCVRVARGPSDGPLASRRSARLNQLENGYS